MVGLDCLSCRGTGEVNLGFFGRSSCELDGQDLQSSDLIDLVILFLAKYTDFDLNWCCSLSVDT